MKCLFVSRVRGWVLLMVLVAFTAAPVEAKSGKAKTMDIVDSVSSNVILTNFAKMLEASDLATFLTSRGPFTIFVPTDSAFSKLPPGTLDTLLRPENQVRLQHIVLFHIANGKRLSVMDLSKLTSLLSCEGTPLTVKKSRSGAEFVMKAKIVHGDIRCLNGTIHEIDTVLMPPEASLPPIAPAPPPAPPVTIAPPIIPSDADQSGTNSMGTPQPPSTNGAPSPVQN